MFKLVVLSALVAVAVAKPSGIGGLAYSAIAAPAVYSAPVAVPAAVSSSYRTDVISKPVVATYAAPAVVAAAPVVRHVAPVAVPAAVSSSYRTDIINRPVVATYAAPSVVAAPAVVSAYAAPALSYTAAYAPAHRVW